MLRVSRQKLIRVLVPLILLPHLAMGETFPTLNDFVKPSLVKARQLIEQGKCTDAEILLRTFQKAYPENAEGAFLLGFALAKQEKWNMARVEFERAISLQPVYISALVELAGVRFKLGLRAGAIDLLQTALHLDPDYSYAAEFLANLFYLEDRQIEALEYWNKVGKPRIQNITYRATVDTESKLIQHIFPLNEKEVLRKEQILDIWWKQERLNLGPAFFWHITPNPSNEWDLEIGLPPRSTLSSLKTILLLNAVRVPVYREAIIEYPLELRSGRKFTGLVRWDTPQKRLRGAASFPFLLSNSDSFRSSFDWRDEAWETGQLGIGFQYKTKQAEVHYDFVMQNRMALSLHGGYEYQMSEFKETQPPESVWDLPHSRHFISLGVEWKQRIGLTASDRAKLDWQVYYSNYFGPDEKWIQARQISSSATIDWQLKPPWKIQLKASLGAGHSTQNIPLNKYFTLGVGQDSPLPLRAHPTVVDKHKGSNPIGRKYILGNLEFHRSLTRWRILEIKGQLFMDIGAVYRPPFGNESRTWYRDVGGGLKFRTLGSDLIEILFGYNLNTQTTNLWIGLPN